ncbi:MAG: aldehyde dehydrogenase family protein [Lentimicrobium sp.]|jgi:glyceraldehyde-3-phosphate dehydrogenase (NADP+)|nr:aldehyde dehydrogenase family protein [Lentimicrobium sp.]
MDIFLSGKFIKTSKELEVINPYNGGLVDRTFLAGDAEFEAAIVGAEQAKVQLCRLSSQQRYEILAFISVRLKERREEFGRSIMLESGKPMRYALGEVDRSIQTFVVAAEEAKRLPREYISLDWTAAGVGKEGLVRYFPIGIVGGIAPFNFPLNLAVHKLAPAIASGCPIMLKPATATPLTSLLLAQIIAETELPDGAVSILPMDRVTGNKLVTDSRISLLSFTGSPEVGWQMKADAGKKKVVLELGGNAGVIVTQSADLDLALNKCLVGGFSYSGQVCIHAQRIFAHVSIFNEFVKRFTEMVLKLQNGNPAQSGTEFSSMINENNSKRVEQWVNEAVMGGARILCGGKRDGSWYAPTLLTNTDTSMKVCSEEVFGPVVTVEPYETFAQALEFMNNTRFGLQAGVFTNNIKEMDQAFSGLEVGGVIINDVPTFRVDHMPYGGIKDSGLGREGVKYAILDMMEPRILVK